MNVCAKFRWCVERGIERNRGVRASNRSLVMMHAAMQTRRQRASEKKQARLPSVEADDDIIPKRLYAYYHHHHFLTKTPFTDLAAGGDARGLS
jgi:hypothetical protein